MTLAAEDDLIAAEYALGTLDGAEREAATRRRATDAAFDGAVASWEQRLAPLGEAGTEAEPPAETWRLILSRIEGLAAPAPAVVPLAAARADRLERQVTRWRLATGAVTALAAALALWIAVGEFRPRTAAGPSLVAFLQATGEEPGFVMGMDPARDAMVVRPIAARTPEGHAFELWVIDPQLGAPRSLGLIDGPATRHSMPDDIPPAILSRATYAVTVEPPGGSPSGEPSGKPVFLGHLVDAPR